MRSGQRGARTWLGSVLGGARLLWWIPPAASQGQDFAELFEDMQHVLGGDLVLDIDGIPMDSVENITRILRHLGQLSPGLQYVVRVLRGGQEITLTGRIPDETTLVW